MKNDFEIRDNYNLYNNFSIKSKHSRSKIYWISQIIGWSIFVIFNISMISLFGHFTWQRFTTTLYMGFVGVCITHIFRYYTIKRKWLKLSLKKIIPRTLLSSFVLGAILYLIILTVSYFIGYTRIEEMKIGNIIWSLFNLTG